MCLGAVCVMSCHNVVSLCGQTYTVNALIEKLDKNGKLTSEEREHHIKENLCLYCGKYGHKASECNKAAAKRCVTTIDSRDSIESNN